MICFDVFKNGSKLCRAGVGNIGVLDTIVTWVGWAEGSRPPDLHVGGLLDRDGAEMHVRWTQQDLQIGDEIVIRLVEAETADAPVTTEARDPREVEKAERHSYNALKKKYGRKRRTK